VAQGLGRLVEIRMDDGAAGGKITCPPRLQPAAGQYLLARRVAFPDAVPAALFPVESSGGVLSVAPPLPASWSVGTELHLRGPLGNGFSPPKQASRWLLISPDRPGRLFPLVNLAVAKKADVALYTPSPPPGLPNAVELLDRQELPGALLWADYLAVDLPLASLTDLRGLLDLPAGAHLPCPGQALVRTPLTCGGAAECGLCAVRTRRGWTLACKDGPVFDLDTLEEE